ncbi:hypothetical protein vBEcoMphAPEC6_00080 [Escherichia phage ph0011]|nr:hypothetical protein vBEcoMphAPEC6_00080 [Escherichia phage ph0011]
MIEQIKSTSANVTGTVSHFTSDESRGVPYCAVHVNTEGNYWFTVYGSYSFGRPGHQKILDKVQPTGKNITAEMFYKKS